MTFFETTEGRLAVALGIGLVLGAERERRKSDGPRRFPAGIRTFALVALLGGVFALSGSVAIVAIGAVVVGALALAAYALGDRTDPGLTTEVALVLAYGLGGLAVREPMAALACGICAATLLAFRTSLHEAVRSVVSEGELRDALLLGVAAVVILPLLPNRSIDPLGVVNPFRLWRLVVAFMALGAVGHVAQRAVGPRYGLALAGFASGFVSSAATIASMGTRARADATRLRAALAGAAASSVATPVQLAILILAADPALLGRLAWPLAAGAAVAFAYAVMQTLGASSGQPTDERGRAFKISTAIAFAALVTVVSLISTLAARWGGRGGLLVTAALAGFADTHSAAAGVASISAGGQLPAATAELGVLAAFSSNTVTKCVVAFTAGGARFARSIVLGLALVTAATWAAYLATR